MIRKDIEKRVYRRSSTHPIFLLRKQRQLEQELERKEAVLEAEILLSDIRINQLLDLKLQLRLP